MSDMSPYVRKRSASPPYTQAQPLSWDKSLSLSPPPSPQPPHRTPPNTPPQDVLRAKLEKNRVLRRQAEEDVQVLRDEVASLKRRVDIRMLESEEPHSGGVRLLEM